MYKDTTDSSWAESAAFKRAFSISVDVHFLGLFDSVSSVGFFGKLLPFAASMYHIRYFRHALALDERRAKFKANMWNNPTKKEQELGKSIRRL